MKLLILLSIFSVNANALECDWTNERAFNQLKEDMVMGGKGVREINEILHARINICRAKCGEQISTFQGLCMAQVNTKKE